MLWHPPFAAFPVVLITLIFLFEVFNYFRPSEFLRRSIEVHLVLAVIFVGAAYLTGLSAEEGAQAQIGMNTTAIDTHHRMARLLLFAIIPCAALRFIAGGAKYYRRGFYIAYAALLLTALMLVICTGYFGGSLVFLHGAGVKS